MQIPDLSNTQLVVVAIIVVALVVGLVLGLVARSRRRQRTASGAETINAGVESQPETEPDTTDTGDGPWADDDMLPGHTVGWATPVVGEGGSTGWQRRIVVVGGRNGDVNVASEIASLDGASVGIITPRMTPPDNIPVLPDEPDTYERADLVVICAPPSRRASATITALGAGARTVGAAPLWGHPQEQADIESAAADPGSGSVSELLEPGCDALAAFVESALGAGESVSTVRWRRGGSLFQSRDQLGAQLLPIVDTVASMLGANDHTIIDHLDDERCLIRGFPAGPRPIDNAQPRFAVEVVWDGSDRDDVVIDTPTRTLTWTRVGELADGSVAPLSSAAVTLQAHVRVADFAIAYQALDEDRPVGTARSRRMAAMADQLRRQIQTAGQIS